MSQSVDQTDGIPVRQLDPATFRECGDCALCCKVLEIVESEDLDKPPGQWCRHWSKKCGCAIYEKREEVCKIFNCFWKVGLIPEDLKPNKTKCVLSMYKEGYLIVSVDTAVPTAWKEGAMGRYLQGWEKPFVVQCGLDKSMVWPTPGLPIHNWRVARISNKGEVERYLKLKEKSQC